MSSLSELFRLQTIQQEEDFNIVASSLDDRQRSILNDELLLSLHEEIGELSRSLRSKPHVLQERPPAGNVLDGIVDTLKLLLCVAHANGLTPEEINQAFKSKTELVKTRRDQYINKLAHETVFVTDLDGCVADIKPFISDVQCGNYGSQAGSIEIEQRKWDWYEKGGFLDLPVLPGARDALHAIRDAGNKIAIITARPSWVHRRVAWDTQSWLKQNDIPYDVLAFGKDKYDELVKCVFPAKVLAFVEDRDKHAMEIAAQRVPVLLMDTEWNQHVGDSEYVKRVFSWDNILEQIKNGE